MVRHTLKIFWSFWVIMQILITMSKPDEAPSIFLDFIDKVSPEAATGDVLWKKVFLKIS